MNSLLKNISTTFYGDLRRYGFGDPLEPTKAIVSKNGHFVEGLSTGKILIGPNKVQFQDGTALDGIDAITMATGYRADLSYCILLLFESDR